MDAVTGSDKQKRKAPGTEAKAAKKRIIIQHSPPYDDRCKALLNKNCIPPGAELFYEVLGGCQCSKSCRMGTMLRNKCLPWTRFPTEQGMFSESFKTWTNPCALGGGPQVRNCILEFMVEDSAGKMVPNYQQPGKKMEAKWTKFWYAVDVLYKYATRDPNQELDDATLIRHTRAFCYSDEHIRNNSSQAVRSMYTQAGLLVTESVADWIRFRDCRKSDMTLTPAQQDSLMHFLLNERRNVVELFEKVNFLLSRKRRDRGESTTIERLTDEELWAYHIDQDNARAAKKKQQEAAAAQLTVILAADKATEQRKEAAAAAGLLELGRAGPATAQSTRHDVAVLLACLHRLALEDTR